MCCMSLKLTLTTLTTIRNKIAQPFSLLLIQFIHLVFIVDKEYLST